MTTLHEIKDEYEHQNDMIEYVLENVLSENISQNDCEDYKTIRNLYNSMLTKACQCSVQSNCNDCYHGGNYILDLNSQELVLNENHGTDLIYECSMLCKCEHRKCHNRLVQYGPRKNLQIIESTRYKSNGLITLQDIPKGGFICEYAGELLTHAEAQRRLLLNEEHHKMNYILCLNEISESNVNSISEEKSHVTIVDPSCRGNIGRYLNHSCAPNCKIYSVRIDCPVPKIGIFAKRHIKACEELCFHYNDGITIAQQIAATPTLERVPCLCDAAHCEKFLPNYRF